MWLALLASLLALAVPVRGASHAAPHAVRAVIVSGDRQTVRSYVATGAPAYLAAFPKPLVVRIAGPGTPEGHPRHVFFSCEGCVFAPAEQHENYDLVDRAKDDNGKDLPGAYDTRPMDGLFVLYVAVQSSAVAGTYRVRAYPVPNKGEKAVATWFTLTTR